jgi:hypothetical protein
MILPGHIALAVLAHTFGNLDLPAAIAGTLAPDAVDKSLSHVLRLTPSGRYLMHSWTGLAVSTGVVHVLGGSKKAQAWAVGYLTHFVGDRGEIPWWFPLRTYDLAEAEDMDGLFTNIIGTSRGRRRLVKEFGFLSLSLAILFIRRSQELKRRDRSESP